jgi:hypothetical protein
MQVTSSPSRFWCRWLLTVIVGVALFGLALVLAPGAVRQGFSLLVYAAPDRLDGFGSDAVAYISLVHAVLGGVMVGWGVALLLVALGPFQRGERVGWQIIAASVAAWFVPDTAYSLWSGFWPNAVLNSGFAMLFAAPLLATYRHFHSR